MDKKSQMAMQKALMRRAQLLGEGLSGGCYRMGCGITGGARKKKPMKPCKAPQVRNPKTNRCKKPKGAKKGAIPPQLQRWLNLVQDVRTENPELSYKEALQEARAIYRNMYK